MRVGGLCMVKPLYKFIDYKFMQIFCPGCTGLIKQLGCIVVRHGHNLVVVLCFLIEGTFLF